MNHDLALGLAHSSEAQLIAGMSRDLIETGLPWHWRPSRVRRAIRDVETQVLVARHRGLVVGFAIMSFQQEDAHLELLAVAPNWQRQGLGQRLMAWLEKTTRVAGIARITLEVRLANTQARRFYRCQGFNDAQLIPRYYVGIEPALRMIRALRTTSGTA